MSEGRREYSRVQQKVTEAAKTSQCSHSHCHGGGDNYFKLKMIIYFKTCRMRNLFTFVSQNKSQIHFISDSEWFLKKHTRNLHLNKVHLIWIRIWKVARKKNNTAWLILWSLQNKSWLLHIYRRGKKLKVYIRLINLCKSNCISWRIKKASTDTLWHNRPSPVD